ncbi:hypothetical protein AK812_SmicGene15278 [Symbiodinium microadriaticum]|uniref:Uncharacterized protein n=1 Tax=Symbiodinium microadriaticum TaxID=2951 RepID=A0A1Q9E3E7_SYMMI|nr:hypothetical protein AK812_SmicGene15278 [Symbiodinium microadriaticum]
MSLVEPEFDEDAYNQCLNWIRNQSEHFRCRLLEDLQRQSSDVPSISADPEVLADEVKNTEWGQVTEYIRPDWPVAAEAAGLTLLLTLMVLVRHGHTPEVSIKPTAGWPPPGSHGLLSSLRKANRAIHSYCVHKLKEATWVYVLAYLGLGASVLVIVIQDLLEQRYANSIAGVFLTVSMPVPNRVLYKYPLVQIRRFNMADSQDSASAREVNDGSEAIDEWYVTPMDTGVKDHCCDFCCRLPWSWALLYSSWYLCSEYSAYTDSAARVLALLLASLLDSFSLQLSQRRRGVAQDPWQTQLWVQSRLVVTWAYLMFEAAAELADIARAEEEMAEIEESIRSIVDMAVESAGKECEKRIAPARVRFSKLQQAARNLPSDVRAQPLADTAALHNRLSEAMKKILPLRTFRKDFQERLAAKRSLDAFSKKVSEAELEVEKVAMMHTLAENVQMCEEEITSSESVLRPAILSLVQLLRTVEQRLASANGPMKVELVNIKEKINELKQKGATLSRSIAQQQAGLASQKLLKEATETVAQVEELLMMCTEVKRLALEPAMSKTVMGELKQLVSRRGSWGETMSNG